MKLSELLKLDEEGRDREYMRLHGLTEVDPIGILEKVLEDHNEFSNENPEHKHIVLDFAKALKLACTRIEVPEGTIRGELDVEGGSE